MQSDRRPAYPATFAVDTPAGITNWRPLVQWILAVPHYIVLYALGFLSQAVAVVSWFVILFTGRLPDGLAGVQCLYLRYLNRTYAYAGFLHEDYPPFAFDTTATDPGDQPRVRTDLAPDLDDRNRLTVAFRLILAIPHAIVLWALGLVAWVLLLVNVFVVLFTGAWSPGMRDVVVGVIRWNTRFYAYVLLLTDEYPPFTLD